MISRESLIEKYVKMEDADLLIILASKDDYTEMAKSVAYDELLRRGIYDSDIKELLSGVSYEYSPIILKNYKTDLKLWQKIAFFLIWFPYIRKMLNYNFHEQGFVLKSRQANY